MNDNRCDAGDSRLQGFSPITLTEGTDCGSAADQTEWGRLVSSATKQKITAELARMRMWRRVGDQREAELCNDRINNLLDRTFAAPVRRTVVNSREVNSGCHGFGGRR
jgi:hypothetical protein